MHQINDHLLIYLSISIGDGLNFYLISAWKSGKKPSAIKLIPKNKYPKKAGFLSSVRFASGSKNLNIIIPVDTTMATTIFFGGSFSFLSLTREQSTPTKMTESKLHDLVIIVNGKLTR